MGFCLVELNMGLIIHVLIMMLNSMSDVGFDV